MIEDTTFTQYCVAPIDKAMIVSSEAGETAYALVTIYLGSYPTTEEEKKALVSAPVSKTTLGYELDMEVDLYPFDLSTYTSDKELNARFCWGDHAPGEKNYQEQCRFMKGDKVLCLIHEATDAVFPAVVVGPITEEYLRDLYERDDNFQINFNTVDDAIKGWSDWDWDSVIVRPLVRLRNILGEDMAETVIVRRVYIFPYKKFEV